jgi:hypothetical protein
MAAFRERLENFERGMGAAFLQSRAPQMVGPCAFLNFESCAVLGELPPL